MPRAGSPYDAAYQRERAALLAGRPRCACGCGALADSADHVPPLYLHRHVPGTGCCRLRPMRLGCNVEQTGGWRAATAVREARKAGIDLRRRAIPAPSRRW